MPPPVPAELPLMVLFTMLKFRRALALMPPPEGAELPLIVLLATDRLAAVPDEGKKLTALIPPWVEFPLMVLLVIVTPAEP